MAEVRKADREAADEIVRLPKCSANNASEIIARHMEPERAAADRRFARLKDALAVLQEARDALCAITTTQMKMRRISPTLADRMDNVGIIERWDSAYDAANGAGK